MHPLRLRSEVLKGLPLHPRALQVTVAGFILANFMCMAAEAQMNPQVTLTRAEREREGESERENVWQRKRR